MEEDGDNLAFFFHLLRREGLLKPEEERELSTLLIRLSSEREVEGILRERLEGESVPSTVHVEALLDLGTHAYLKGDYEKAKHLLEEALRLTEDEEYLFGIYLMLFACTFRLRTLSVSASYHEKILAIDPSFNAQAYLASPMPSFNDD